LKLLESGEISGQTKITDYYEVVNRIGVVIKENYKFIEQSELKFNVEQNNGRNFHSFFSKLLHNAEKNCSKFPIQRRHDNLIKQFATALYIVGQLHTTLYIKHSKVLALFENCTNACS